LPAAGFDDCEHRFIPSCSIPASDCSGPAFWSVVMGSIFARDAQKQTAREKSRAGLRGLIAAGSPESRQTTPKMGQNEGFAAFSCNHLV